jgi:hypothetical protein
MWTVRAKSASSGSALVAWYSVFPSRDIITGDGEMASQMKKWRLSCSSETGASFARDRGRHGIEFCQRASHASVRCAANNQEQSC